MRWLQRAPILLDELPGRNPHFLDQCIAELSQMGHERLVICDIWTNAPILRISWSSVDNAAYQVNGSSISMTRYMELDVRASDVVAILKRPEMSALFLNASYLTNDTFNGHH